MDDGSCRKWFRELSDVTDSLVKLDVLMMLVAVQPCVHVLEISLEKLSYIPKDVLIANVNL